MDCRNWHLGLAPGTAMERAQNEADAAYDSGYEWPEHVDERMIEAWKRKQNTSSKQFRAATSGDTPASDFVPHPTS